MFGYIYIVLSYQIIVRKLLNLVLQQSHVFLFLLPADAGRLSVLDHPLLPLDVPQLLGVGGDGGGAARDQGTGLSLDDDLAGCGRLVAEQDQGGGLTHLLTAGWLAQLRDGNLPSELGDGGGGVGLGEDCVDGGQDVVVDRRQGGRVLLAAAGRGRLRLDTVTVAAVRVSVGEIFHQDIVQHSRLQALQGRQVGGSCHPTGIVDVEICNVCSVGTIGVVVL